jgi:hypothetical protein
LCAAGVAREDDYGVFRKNGRSARSLISGGPIPSLH